jgi:hypothetical protein
MGKLTLKAIGVLLKKIAYIAKQYTDFSISANSVHLYEKATANTGYLKTYILSTALSLATVSAGNTIGEIDIPKDLLVKSGKLLVVEAGEAGGTWDGKLVVVAENGVALESANYYEAPSTINAAGSWIDLVINTVAGDETASHVSFNVSKLIDIYTNGNGLDLNNGAFSIKLNATASGLTVDANGLAININSSNAHGLSITASGLELALAVAPDQANSVAGNDGAISAAFKGQLDKNLDDCDMELLTDAELASWFGYDITGTPASGSEAETIKTGLTNLSTDSITDEPGA